MAYNDGAPSANIRVNSGLEAACDAGWRETTVGGSWHWSPRRQSCRAPRVSGTSVAASVACGCQSEKGVVVRKGITVHSPSC